MSTVNRDRPDALSVPEILRIIYPLDFWPLIVRGTTQHGLDPYLMAALMAQESTFTPEIKSGANAVGLMQLMPSTGKRYARKVGIKGFTTRSLTDPPTSSSRTMQVGRTHAGHSLTR